jgi:DNA-directed RNA polymerase specialized sigma24 family protein
VGGGWPAAGSSSALDPAEEVAIVAHAKRGLLLGANRFRLRWEDLEDCYSQATLELVAHVRAGGRFSNRRHLGNALELRFLSRIRDRRRALGGRSPMQSALEAAVSLSAAGEEGVEIVDGCAEVERLVMLRHDLERLGVLARELTADQRLVLASQLGQQHSSAEFCRRFDWSAEKYRKVAQRGRARLRELMDLEESGVPSAARPSEKGPGTRL